MSDGDNDPVRFWKQEQRRREDNPYVSNKLWKQTWEDMNSIKSDKHPKELYTECISNNAYWRFYTSGNNLTVDDLAMALCKNQGCDLNYCGLIKKSIPSDWRGSSDCSHEYKEFQSCIARERRTWLGNKPDMSMYDYIQMRYEKDKKENKHKPVFEMELKEEGTTQTDELQKAKRSLEHGYM
ncbi:unnamed protein product [Moneuplotes crassus]|uniref:Uncharacterized protein n=1 Tax=Euplotes crassus TaxID=5936 RepID=A0AAD1UDR0_EUPCR|nr:unnamed protein product [Moneuplotes crassus]